MRRGWIVLGLALLASGCQQSPPPAAARPLVVTSFYPLYEFARQVAGERAEVLSLVPPGAEPHAWEPAPADVARAQRARVFVYNGAGFEPWAERLARDLDPAATLVVRATEGLALVEADLPGHGHQHGAAAGTAHRGHAHDTERGRGSPDPHVWLDPVLAQAQVETVRAALTTADPDGAQTYADNARRFTERLQALHGAYEAGLATCERRDVVVSHAAFGYLTRRYRLAQVSIMGLSPEAEPGPAELAALVRFARRHEVRTIFFETLVSAKLAETLAREVGAQSLVLNPVEGLTREEAAAGKDYVALMEANLANLRTALGCR
jgi:zinc transport system substrate-binding protein